MGSQPPNRLPWSHESPPGLWGPAGGQQTRRRRLDGWQWAARKCVPCNGRCVPCTFDCVPCNDRCVPCTAAPPTKIQRPPTSYSHCSTAPCHLLHLL